MDTATFLFAFGTAEFDEARFELRVAGLPIDVERRALEVLVYLLRHAGEVVTKEELFQEVWAGRATVEKSLPTAVTKLRRGLGEVNAGFVTTVARIGYRFDGLVTRTVVGRQPTSKLQLTAGQSVPGRPNFELRAQLGRSSGGEVWLAAHSKTREQRVYKFAFDSDRVRALKRETTLLRVLQDSLGDPGHFVELIDWNFSTSPYFLECKYGGQTLTDWANEHLIDLDVQQRIDLFLQIVDSVAAAHSVGVLHKDLKPANVLVTGDTTHPRVRLTDFGSGHLLDPDSLAQLNITRMGMTVEEGASLDSTSGTPMYVPPEHFSGQAPTQKSDVFALGILLYQIMSGRIGQPMVSGWESAVDDEFVCEDIRLATDGNPQRRLPTAAALAERLRNMSQRRTSAQEQRFAEEAALRNQRALERTAARRPYVYAVVALLALGAGTAIVLQQRALAARDQARNELERSNALATFLNEDLIGSANPLVWAKGQDATLREVLLAVRERIPERFTAQPAAAAAIHASMASLLGAIDLFSEAESEANSALEKARTSGANSADLEFEARLVLARVLSKQSRFDEAEAQVLELERLSNNASIKLARPKIAAARSAMLGQQGDFGQSLLQLRVAIDGLNASQLSTRALRDSLRLDLVITLAMAGQDSEALRMGQSFITEAQARKDDNELLVALTKVALVRAHGENHDEAIRLLLEAQPIVAKRLGENHSRHLSLLNELMSVYFRRADWPKALAYADSVHERVRAKFGTDHVATYVTLVNWARILDEAGRPDEAANKARDGHRELVRLVGAKAPQAQDAAVVLALIELELGRSREALVVINQLDVKILESFRATGLWGAAIDSLRGIAFQQLGEFRAAKPLLNAALEALKEQEQARAAPSRLYLVAKRARSLIP